MVYSKYVLAFILIFAGVMHFARPFFFIKIMPAYIPFHLKLVYISGIVEVLCGILLLFPQTQTFAAWLSIALFVAVFPANIEMAREYYVLNHQYLWLALLRLPLQLVLIWWAFQFTK